jgi:hypothetical protein
MNSWAVRAHMMVMGRTEYTKSILSGDNFEFEVKVDNDTFSQIWTTQTTLMFAKGAAYKYDNLNMNANNSQA